MALFDKCIYIIESVVALDVASLYALSLVSRGARDAVARRLARCRRVFFKYAPRLYTQLGRAHVPFVNCVPFRRTSMDVPFTATRSQIIVGGRSFNRIAFYDIGIIVATPIDISVRVVIAYMRGTTDVIETHDIKTTDWVLCSGGEYLYKFNLHVKDARIFNVSLYTPNTSLVTRVRVFYGAYKKTSAAVHILMTPKLFPKQTRLVRLPIAGNLFHIYTSKQIHACSIELCDGID